MLCAVLRAVFFPTAVVVELDLERPAAGFFFSAFSVVAALFRSAPGFICIILRGRVGGGGKETSTAWDDCVFATGLVLSAFRSLFRLEVGNTAMYWESSFVEALDDALLSLEPIAGGGKLKGFSVG